MTTQDGRPRSDSWSWYRMSVQTKTNTARVDIYDEIGPWGTSAKDFVAALNKLDVKNIDLHVSSPGGDVFDGVAILNALRDHPARVVATVDSLAASAASFIVMGADEVIMGRNSELMIHDAFGLGMGDSTVMRDLADRLDKVSDNIASIYAEKAGGTVEDWRTMMRAETWYSADEAVTAGLADRVSAVAPPADDAKARFDYSIFNYAGRQAAPPPPTVPGVSARTTTPLPAGQGQPEKEGAAVADTAKLREDLGLAPDASNDQVWAAFASTMVESPPAASPAPTPPAPAAPQTPPAPETPPVRLDVEPAPTDNQLNLLVSKSVWEEQQRTLASMKDFIDKTKRDERDTILAQAVTDGKFTPAQLNDFKKSWDANPDNTRDIVARLTPNSALAVQAAGYANDVEGDNLEAEFAGMFPPAWKER